MRNVRYPVSDAGGYHPLVETEGLVVDWLLTQPAKCYYSAVQIAVAIRRSYTSVGTVLRTWRALGMMREFNVGREIFVQLDPMLR
ncbi:hypothetical protein LCGC14_1535970 [marine sediment metagenome]|uniref:Uncharacterized protein n=1 Tax=marine sediment metagenome TaxID=412755 RepID=A0A0F9LVB3_9ZZZZ